MNDPGSMGAQVRKRPPSLTPVARLADVVLCSTAQKAPLPAENATARIAQPNRPDALFVATAQRDRKTADANFGRTMRAVQSRRKA